LYVITVEAGSKAPPSGADAVGCHDAGVALLARSRARLSCPAPAVRNRSARWRRASRLSA
jgi:hypothetical protein